MFQYRQVKIITARTPQALQKATNAWFNKHWSIEVISTRTVIADGWITMVIVYWLEKKG